MAIGCYTRSKNARYLYILGHPLGRPRLRGVFDNYELFLRFFWLTCIVGFAPLLGQNMAQVVASERRLPSLHPSHPVVVESSSSGHFLCHVGSLPSFGVWFLRRVVSSSSSSSSVVVVVVSLCPPPRDRGVSTSIVSSVVVVVVFSTWRPSSSSSSSVAVVVVVSCSCRLFSLTTYRPALTEVCVKSQT